MNQHPDSRRGILEYLKRHGAATIDNLRLLCGPHNRLEAEKLMGVRRRE